eukprot:12273348-Prorocentrum_lima.AAC.1
MRPVRIHVPPPARQVTIAAAPASSGSWTWQTTNKESQGELFSMPWNSNPCGASSITARPETTPEPSTGL